MRDAKLALLFVCKALGLFSIARWLTRDRLKILCYHGFEFADETAFRPKLFMKPSRFGERLETIKRQGFNVLALDEAIDRLYAGTLPENPIAITIDDGFHSFYRLAIPQLKRHGYPATAYITTYYVQHQNPIYRLVIQYMFWKTRKRELKLMDVPWAGDRVVSLRDATEAERVMWTCIEYGERQCTEEQRRAICRQLGALLDVPYVEIVQSRALHLMSPDELRNLGDANVAVELHSHRHTFSSDDRAAAEREIMENRAVLQGCVEGESRHFCYPSGIWHERQWPWLDHLRVKSSTTCTPGLNDRSTPRHALRRFLDSENIHQLEFEAALSGFSDVARGMRTLWVRDRAPRLSGVDSG